MAEPNIYTAINAVMAEVGYVKKQRSSGLNYTYAGEAALIGALRPEMVEQGIVVFVERVEDVVARDYQSKSGSTMTNVTLTAHYKLVHAASGTSIQVAARGEGSDSGDKANNKAMTCAYKYMLRQTFMIETGDDPDNFQPASRQQEAPATNGNGKPAEQPAVMKSAPAKVETPAEQPAATVWVNDQPPGEMRLTQRDFWKVANPLIQEQKITAKDVTEIERSYKPDYGKAITALKAATA